MLAVHEGIEGLLEENIKEMQWQDVSGWVGQGGAFLGTKRTLPEKHMDRVVAVLKKFNIQVCIWSISDLVNDITGTANVRYMFPCYISGPANRWRL